MHASTRGLASGLKFEDVLKSGYCSDGGMVMPRIDLIPTLTTNILRSEWSGLSYPKTVEKVLSLFISREEISEKALSEIVGRSFARFSDPSVVNIKKLKDGLNVAEMFHGPSGSFKDLAMSCLAQLLDHFLSIRKEHCTVLVGTSGDTGSSAIEALKCIGNADVIVLLPQNRCTRTQELQMTTILSKNVHVFRVDGTSDELDEPIRRSFADPEFVSKHRLMSVNSLNWVRVLVQIAHYIYLYLQMCPECDSEMEIVVPTGALGNAAAGCVAKRMGLPIKLICAVNSNQSVLKALATGTFCTTGEVIQTLAPAMDIQSAYNMERLIWLYSDGNAELVRKLLEELEAKGSVKIPEIILSKIKEAVSVESISDRDILSAMSRCWTENNYRICPHTATSVQYHYTQQAAGNLGKAPRICIATASPSKFPEATEKAGIPELLPSLLKKLEDLPTRYTDMNKGDNWFEMLTKKIEEIDAVRN